MKFLVHFPIFVLLAAAISARRVGASSLGTSRSSSLSVSIDTDSTFESNLDSLPESRSDPIEIVVDDAEVEVVAEEASPVLEVEESDEPVDIAGSGSGLAGIPGFASAPLFLQPVEAIEDVSAATNEIFAPISDAFSPVFDATAPVKLALNTPVSATLAKLGLGTTKALKASAILAAPFIKVKSALAAPFIALGAKKAALGIKGAKLIGAGLFKKAAVGAKTVAVKAGVGALALGTKAVVGGKILGGKAKLAAPMVLVPAAGMKLAGGMAGGILEKSGIANVPKAVLGALGSPALGVGQVLTGGALVPEAAAMGAAEPRDDQFVLVRLGGGPIADSLANLNIQHPGLGIQIVNAGDLVQVGVTPEGTEVNVGDLVDVNVDTDSEVTVETIDDSDSLVFREPLFQEARRPTFGGYRF